MITEKQFLDQNVYRNVAFKDTLTAFDDFKNQQQKFMK